MAAESQTLQVEMLETAEPINAFDKAQIFLAQQAGALRKKLSMPTEQQQSHSESSRSSECHGPSSCMPAPEVETPRDADDAVSADLVGELQEQATVGEATSVANEEPALAKEEPENQEEEHSERSDPEHYDISDFIPKPASAADQAQQILVDSAVALRSGLEAVVEVTSFRARPAAGLQTPADAIDHSADRDREEEPASDEFIVVDGEEQRVTEDEAALKAQGAVEQLQTVEEFTTPSAQSAGEHGELNASSVDKAQIFVSKSVEAVRKIFAPCNRGRAEQPAAAA